MFQRLKQSGRLNITLLLIGMSFFCFGISMTRYIITETKVFLFLNWNLFLAFIPWLISTVIVVREMSNKFALVILILTWLLFFPNSPYILTDLFHLRMYGSAPIWFDLVVILSFAWTGLVYGFRSLMDIEFLLKKYLSKQVITFLTIVFMFIASFGIYLGRYLRWNSWDIVSNPFGLFNDIFDRILNPMDNPRAWGMTVLMGILLNMMYFSIKFMKAESQETI